MSGHLSIMATHLGPHCVEIVLIKPVLWPPLCNGRNLCGHYRGVPLYMYLFLGPRHSRCLLILAVYPNRASPLHHMAISSYHRFSVCSDGNRPGGRRHRHGHSPSHNWTSSSSDNDSGSESDSSTGSSSVSGGKHSRKRRRVHSKEPKKRQRCKDYDGNLD